MRGIPMLSMCDCRMRGRLTRLGRILHVLFAGLSSAASNYCFWRLLHQHQHLLLLPLLLLLTGWCLLHWATRTDNALQVAARDHILHTVQAHNWIGISPPTTQASHTVCGGSRISHQTSRITSDCWQDPIKCVKDTYSNYSKQIWPVPKPSGSLVSNFETFNTAGILLFGENLTTQ